MEDVVCEFHLMTKHVQTCCEERMRHGKHLDHTSVTPEHWPTVLTTEEKCGCRRTFTNSLLSKWQNVLVSLEDSSNNNMSTQFTSSHLQTFSFSLHLSEHVVLFRCCVSRGPRTSFRTPGNQPSEVPRPPNVTFSFPQGEAFHFLPVWADNGCSWWRNKRRNILQDQPVWFYWCTVGVNLLPSEVQESQLFPALFCKSHYPPLISCSVQYMVQTVSALSVFAPSAAQTADTALYDIKPQHKANEWQRTLISTDPDIPYVFDVRWFVDVWLNSWFNGGAEGDN